MDQQQLKTPSLSRRVATGAGWVIAWRMVNRNLGLISTLILVRFLDPSDIGLIALATTFATAVDALSSFGVQDALIRQSSPGRDMYDSAFCLGLLRGFFTAGLIAAMAWPTAAFFDEPRLAAVLFVLAFATLLTAFENIGTVDFRRHMTFQKEFHMQVASRVVGVAVTIGAVLIWRNYWALVCGILATRLVRLVQSYVMSSYRPGFTLRAWRSLIGFSLWTWALTMLSQIRDRADSLIIGRMLTMRHVAIFSVGQEIGSLPVTELGEPLHRALFSAFVATTNNAESPRTLYLLTIEAAFLVILPVGIGISVIADPLVRLMLGERWLDVIPIVQILAVFSTTSIFRLVSEAMYAAAGDLRLNFTVTAISALVRVPLLLLLIVWAPAGRGARAWPCVACGPGAVSADVTGASRDRLW